MPLFLVPVPRKPMVVAAAVADLDTRAPQTRAPDRLGQHRGADQRDQPVAGQAHARDLGRRAAECLAQDEVGERHHDDRGQHVEHRDLQAHHEPAPDLCVAGQKIRSHDHLAVPRPERVHDPVGEREREADQQRARGVAVADRSHVLGDQPVALALEAEQRPPDQRHRPGRPHDRGRVVGRRRARGRFARGRRIAAGERVGARRHVRREPDQQQQGEQAAADHRRRAQLVAQFR